MPQKKRMRQIEKQQRMRQKGPRRTGVKQGKTRINKTIGSLEISNIPKEELMDHMERNKAITPTGVATQFNIKVSMAKKLLEELRRNEVVELVSKSHNLKVYSLSQH
jgi:ribosomal protein S25